MKKILTIAVAVLGMGLCAQEAPSLETEAEKDWGVSLSLSYASQYFDKGSYVNPDPIFQGDFEFTWKELFVGATGFFDCTDANDHRQTFEEYDFTFGWQPSVGGDWDGFIKGLDFKFAYINYVYPRVREDDSNELNVAVNAQCLLSPGVDLYWDFEDDLWYGNLNVSHDIELADNVTWNLGGQLWWGNSHFQERDYELNRTSFISAVLETSVKFAINDYVTVGPFATCGWALGSKMRDNWREGDDQSAFNATFGINVGVEF